MKQKNYSKFSENLKKSDNTETTVPAEELNPLATEQVVEEVNEVVPETVEPKKLPEPIIGVVVNCEKLNVRAEPSKDAKVLQVINKNDEVTIEVTLLEDFHKVITASGVEGYCMSKYIKIK